MATTQTNGRLATDRVFTGLLASAYSLQEKQDSLKLRLPAAKVDELMSAVLDTQRLVVHQAVHPETALHLIATRTQKLCGAAGTAVALLHRSTLEYQVASGVAAGLQGRKISADASYSFQQLHSQPAVTSSTWQDKSFDGSVGANCLLSFPIHRKAALAGCIQLFSRSGPFTDEAAFAGELMSAVLTQLVEQVNIPEGGFVESPQIPQGMPEGFENQEFPIEYLEKLIGLSAPEAANTRSRERADSEADVAFNTQEVWNHLQTALREQSGHVLNPDGSLSSNRRFESQAVTHSAASAEASQAEGRKRTVDPSGPVVDRQKTGTTTTGISHHNGQTEKMMPSLGKRINAVVFPILVLLFVAFANYCARGYGWPLEIATIVIVAFAAVELNKRFSDPTR